MLRKAGYDGVLGLEVVSQDVARWCDTGAFILGRCTWPATVHRPDGTAVGVASDVGAAVALVKASVPLFDGAQDHTRGAAGAGRVVAGAPALATGPVQGTALGHGAVEVSSVGVAP